MASMVKEKRREKKKYKEKKSARLPENEPSLIGVASDKEDRTKILDNVSDSSNQEILQAVSEVTSDTSIQNTGQEADFKSPWKELSTSANNESNKASKDLARSEDGTTDISQQNITDVDSFKNLNTKLERMTIPSQSSELDEGRMLELENVDAYLQPISKELQNSDPTCLESATPSAPMFEEQIETQAQIQEEILNENLKVKCKPLDEVFQLYGGTEMVAVRCMSEREEAEVVAGPNCGPDHPLIDLLSTFRSSLRAVERERSRLASNFDDEEKSRSTLWKVDKRNIHLKQECNCGLNVHMKATYEHATLLKERLPVAKLKLEGLLKDVQESYCHHQHAALLAHCQIEEIVSETIKSSKTEIRNALALILQALRMSDSELEALPEALQRWAEILSGALIADLELEHLLFVIHQMFRQTRSVHWAARVFDLRIYDDVTAVRTLSVLEILLSKSHLEAAVECIEESDETWEEVDMRGGGGAVSAGTLRERDLIALLRAFPLQQLIAKLAHFSQSDFRQATEFDWGDASGGNGLLKSCYGVRVLLSVLQRGISLHPVYERLHGVLRDVACSALTSLACFYWSPRVPYYILLEETISAEVEAAFAAGFTLFGTNDLHRLPATLLSEHTAKDYCYTFIVGLHDKSPVMIESLSVEAPVLPCGVRTRIVTHAAIYREQDHELARVVLDFLLQTAFKRKIVPCKAGCESAARECLPLLLTAHPYLRSLSLRTIADEVETQDPANISVLQVNKWRPCVVELQATLQDWSKRCPALLQQLLLQLDYTPYTGLPLPQQLHIGGWLCSWSASSPAALEASWRVLLRLRTHRVCWPLGDDGACPAPPDPEPTDLFSMAYAVLSSEWGHSVPLICSVGVNAILTLCATRPREAVHCLAPVMLMLTLSPESISLTPKFTELFTILLNCGPNLVQRAFGRGGASGTELLLRLVLAQVDNIQVAGAASLLPAWMHALWRVPAALSILDIAALAARDCYVLDMHADLLLQQDQNSKEFITNAVRFAFTSPLLCECILKVAHAHEVRIQLFPALVSALYQQRTSSQRIHVDKALLSINGGMTSEDLVIYKCAAAALVAPFQHPSHLTLWRLFFHMYLQRPADLQNDTAPPCGTLFFSGLIKSRVLSQIKKRLIETATYHHHNEAETYKNEGKKQSNPQPSTSNRVVRSESAAFNNSLLPTLTLADLTGESKTDSDGDSDSESDGSESIQIDGSTEEAIEMENRRNINMATYHAGAEVMIREYSRWLDDGENVREKPAHAHIARFIPPQAIDEAWESTLSRCRPPPSADLDTFLRPSPAPPYNAEPAKTPLNIAVASILSVKCRSPISESLRSRRTIKPRVDKVEDEVYQNISLLLHRTNALLEAMEMYAKEWGTEVSRISSADSRLWDFVSALRVPRPLPPVKKQCANKCKPIAFHLNTHEWCISGGAERGIRESRSASLAGIRRLTRARLQVARTAAALHTIARRTRVAEHAVKVLDLSWRSAGKCLPCNAVNTALGALFNELAQRWITSDGRLCQHMLSKALANITTPLQETLCGSLVAPREMQYCAWPDVYNLLLESNLPSHILFSYLSRFEMNRWSQQANANQRHEVLFALLSAAQHFGADPVANSVLVELIGLHTALLIKPQELSWILNESLKISASGVLPPVYWEHLLKATETHAKDLTLNDLGNILHGIGSVWFICGTVEGCEKHATFAPCVADLLCILMRAFVAAAVQLTYEPERVGWCAWTAMSESWAPWVFPNSVLPHPAHGAGAHAHAHAHTYTGMLKRFTGCIRQVMRDCPGSEIMILQAIYYWVVKTFHAVEGMEAPQKPRAKLSALIEQLAKLPWCEQQWFTAPSVMTTFNQIHNQSAINEELLRWCCARFQATKADTLLKDVDKIDVDLPKTLAILLHVFTGNLFVNNPEFLKEGAKLPWWHLTEEGLLGGLNDFFKTHFDIAQPFHEKPQSNVLVHAAELYPRQQYSAAGRRKRQLLVTEWMKATSCGPLKPHRAAFTQYMLKHITRIDPILEKPEEAKDLLYWLACLSKCESEDETWTVVPAWRHWICEAAPAHMLPACVGMTNRITILKIGAPIADDAIRMHLHNCEGGWAEIRDLWSKPLFQARSHVELGALHSAYASVPARAQPAAARHAFAHLQTLTQSNFNFIKNDAIVAVWICYAARVASECVTTIATEPTFATSATEATTSSDVASATAATNDCTQTSASEIEECKHTAFSLLTAWGQQQRRSILKLVTLQADIERPTVRHRTLVRLAECILCPSAEAAQAYESVCAGLSGFNGDMSEWGRAPSLRKLARLAGRLYPAAYQRYFQWELDQTPGE